MLPLAAAAPYMEQRIGLFAMGHTDAETIAALAPAVVGPVLPGRRARPEPCRCSGRGWRQLLGRQPRLPQLRKQWRLVAQSHDGDPVAGDDLSHRRRRFLFE